MPCGAAVCAPADSNPAIVHAPASSAELPELFNVTSLTFAPVRIRIDHNSSAGSAAGVFSALAFSRSECR